MAKPVLIFANPTSGRGRGARLAEAIGPALTARDFRPTLWIENPASFNDVAGLALSQAIIVIGGDGTLRSVVDRLLTLSPDPLPPILCIGFGTANLMQRHLKLRYPKNGIAERVADLLDGGKTRAIDVGTVGGQVFLLMTSCGYDAGVVHALAKVRRGPITKFSYIAPAFQQLRQQHYPSVRVVVDGNVVFDHAPAQVFIGNVAEYGTGFPVLDEADSSDGTFDICVLPCGSHIQFVQLAWRLVVGGHRAAPGVVYLRGKSVRIESSEPLPVQIDGDPAGTTPVQLGLLERQVSFIVP